MSGCRELGGKVDVERGELERGEEGKKGLQGELSLCYAPPPPWAQVSRKVIGKSSPAALQLDRDLLGTGDSICNREFKS